MADFNIVDLSIFRLPLQTTEHNSWMRRLNWSLLFFSLRFRDFLQKEKGEVIFKYGLHQN